ncbi:hypothetical protein AVEN_41336-1 [Araneus ventricosus]|uniref:Uncharacterized protein n=1 Tax=Araneus ventricosus TaxID=182803 RepID=A0A4Y2IT21_ARAVE|nr:hypothetical protein AVEN_41336-1 [Araneus ventricosus]
MQEPMSPISRRRGTSAKGRAWGHNLSLRPPGSVFQLHEHSSNATEMHAQARLNETASQFVLLSYIMLPEISSAVTSADVRSRHKCITNHVQSLVNKCPPSHLNYV